MQRETIQDRPILRLTDQDAGLSACLSPQDGGELSSLAVRQADGQWRELLFRANDWRPIAGWPGRAPWLWPLAGRCNADGSNVLGDNLSNYRWQGRIHRMPYHGFVRHRPWQVATSADEGHVRLTYTSQPDDRPMYPFDFSLSLTMAFVDRALTLRFGCTASPANDGPMPFTFGFHLSFDLAAWWGHDWLAGHVENFQPLAWGTCHRPMTDPPVTIPSQPLLTDSAMANAIIPTTAGRAARLVSPQGDKVLAMSFDTHPPAQADQPLWVAYRDPADRFFCWEPWIGWPQGLHTGQGRVDLLPGQSWQLTCKLTTPIKAP